MHGIFKDSWPAAVKIDAPHKLVLELDCALRDRRASPSARLAACCTKPSTWPKTVDAQSVAFEMTQRLTAHAMLHRAPKKKRSPTKSSALREDARGPGASPRA